jgi:tetratricopeptide (TPR) repeat protein
VNRPLPLFIVLALAAVLTQGFQCASSGVATAKRAMQTREYDKAKVQLQQALVAQPGNCEARIMLGDVYALTGNVDSMVVTYQEALTCSDLTQAQREDLSIKLFNAWVGAYNGGIQSYNAYVSSKADSDLVASKTSLQQAIALKPMFTDPYGLLAMIYEMQGDTTRAADIYRSWYSYEKSGFEWAMANNITLGSSRGQVMAVLGAPAEAKVDSLSDGTLLFKDRFDGAQPVYLFSALEAGASDTLVEGWTVQPDAALSAAEKWRTRAIQLNPLKALAFIEYQKGNKEASLQYASTVVRIRPTDQEVVPLRTQLLQDLGKTDEALAEIRKLMAANPTVMNYRLQYASLLSTVGRSSEAISEYKTVLETEPTNSTALYNLAASYKNMAGEKQLAELKKLDADPNYQINQAYVADLRTAAGYFEQLRKDGKYGADMVVLEQLANTYEVLQEKTKVRALIMELEALSEKYENNPNYWRIMEGLYGRNKMIEKMKEAAKKAGR